jgi:formate dehydrogenase major subunit
MRDPERTLFQGEAVLLEGKRDLPDPILTSQEYGEKNQEGKVKHLDVQRVAKEINGYYVDDVYDKTANPPKLIGKKGNLVPNFVSLRDDGSTSSGNWLYCGSYTQIDGKVINLMARRGKEDPTGLVSIRIW